MTKVLIEFFFRKSPRTKPKNPIPTEYTELNQLPHGEYLVWFGHSSYYLQTAGLKFLIDPVMSGHASPLAGVTKAFAGTDPYQVKDLPDLDYLLISHDHYDHLDYETVEALQPKVKKVVCGLGVGAHLEKWGFTEAQIIEVDWHDVVKINAETQLHILPARHFSGRLFTRNNTLWVSFLLETDKKKIYLGGDSGYDKHFKAIGDQFGPIDLAILENGQYNPAWHEIHFLPGENLQAALDLKAKSLMPVHSGKFDLALHDWDEPLKEIMRRNEAYGFPLITPKIGELVRLDDSSQKFKHWWEGAE